MTNQASGNTMWLVHISCLWYLAEYIPKEKIDSSMESTGFPKTDKKILDLRSYRFDLKLIGLYLVMIKT